MPRHEPVFESTSNDYDDLDEPGFSAESDSEGDSDRELQLAFERGLIKPGLNVVKPAKRAPINNKTGLESAYSRLANGLPWIERMDVTSERKATKLVTNEENDFEREISFYTQAQSSVAAALDKLKALNVPICRPSDYYAEMAKSDSQMQKVRAYLLTVQKDKQRQTAVKQLREQRKYGAQVQKKVAVERQSEKKKLMQAVKQHRKGMKEQLEEMLGDAHSAREAQKDNQQKNAQKKRLLSKKRQFKNDKYGFGGRKKGSKRNTKDSAQDMSLFSHRGGVKTNKKGAPLKGAPKKGVKAKRPGKSARHRGKK